MRVLIADDDFASRVFLCTAFEKWGYEVQECSDGQSAWAVLEAEDAPALAILDWMMPGLDGLAVCRSLRRLKPERPTYVILVTGRDERKDLLAGLAAGADDYLTKPVDLDELRARVAVGERVLGLLGSLAERVRELEEAQRRVRQLQGLLPICMYCKKIRNDENYWEQVDGYIAKHADVNFSHGVCPDCYQRVVLPQLKKL